MVILLASRRTHGGWDFYTSLSSAFDYDSNITRSASGGPILGDTFEHHAISVNVRMGTETSPAAFLLGYNYSADIFNHYTQFNTFTHNVNFAGRIGRSNVIIEPYFLGSFRSVDDPSARDSGRESYHYLQAGMRGENKLTPVFAHTYDFSHSTVDYFQRTNDNFEIWELYQELDANLFPQSSTKALPSYINAKVFPWLDLKQTSPSNQAAVEEVAGGAGGTVDLGRQLAVQARVGWGEVGSSDPAIGEGHYSGLRYHASVEYLPLNELHFRLSYDRDLSFAPTTVGRNSDILDFVIESPLDFGSHIVLIPAVEIYHAESNDYLDPGSAWFPQPSLRLSYEINDHAAVYLQTQYRDTQQDEFATRTYIRVLQTSLGLTATF
jgi:hypothetical protein